MSHINLLDIAVIFILIHFFIRGIVGGLVRELFSTAALVLGVFIAHKYAMDLLPSVAQFIKLPPFFQKLISYSLIYIVTWLGFSSFFPLAQRMVKRDEALQSLDKIAGALLGLAKGILVSSFGLSLLISFVAHSPLLNDSFFVSTFAGVIEFCKPFVPQLY